MRRALCVGINDYPLQDSDLHGCVNDARGWADVLVDVAGFDRGDIRVLLDDDATKRAMLRELDRLLDGLGTGDIAVFAYSGHGTYVADESSDEVYDEALCPYDAKDDLIIDDELRTRFDTIPRGATVTVLLDSCFSGSATRALPGVGAAGNRLSKSLPPSRLGRREIDVVNAQPRATRRERSMPEVLMSGCQENQESADDLIDGVWGGAMSANAIRLIRAMNGRVSWQRLHRELVDDLATAQYSQVPQLEGRSKGKRRRVFRPTT
jgi:hypothetical protein